MKRQLVGQETPVRKTVRVGDVSTGGGLLGPVLHIRIPDDKEYYTPLSPEAAVKAAVKAEAEAEAAVKAEAARIFYAPCLGSPCFEAVNGFSLAYNPCSPYPTRSPSLSALYPEAYEPASPDY